MKILDSALKRFFKNKVGKYGFFLLISLFILSLCAPFLANENPLFISYKGRAYFPIFNTYLESDFDGALPTKADYQDKALLKNIQSNGFIIFAPLSFGQNSIDIQSATPFPSAPSLRHPLGTDDMGRDILARSLYGLRLSLIFGFLLAFTASFIGIFFGSIQGYFGGKTDLYFQRFLEIWTSLPQLFILIILSSLIVPSFWSLFFILLCFSWTTLIGVVRAEFLKVRNFDYIKYAQSLGVPPFQIMFRHLLPNALVSVFSFFPFILAGSIVSLTSLNFLGFGLPPDTASLGDLIRQGKENIYAPWIGLTVILLLSFVLCLLIFIGQALRDAFDPKNKESVK